MKLLIGNTDFITFLKAYRIPQFNINLIQLLHLT